MTAAAVEPAIHPRTVTGAALPPLIWQPGRSARPFHLAHWEPITARLGDRKPAGGLWTCPVLSRDGRGRPVTGWSRFRETNLHYPQSNAGRLLRAAAHARVYVIDSADDLTALLRLYPREHSTLHPALRPIFETLDACWQVDWERLAGRVDAVYLTAAGQAATHTGEPNLWGWDFPTVLFLRPAVVDLGDVALSPAAHHRAAIARADANMEWFITEAVELLRAGVQLGPADLPFPDPDREPERVCCACPGCHPHRS